MSSSPLSLVLVIGPGAVGMFIAQRLVRLGIQVAMIGRQGVVPIREIFLAEEGQVTLDLPAISVEALRQASMVFVTVKAFDLAPALAWTRVLNPGTPVIVTVNGAVHPIIATEKTQSPGNQWRFGSCTYGISRSTSGAFEQRSKSGRIVIGPMDTGEPPTAAEKAMVTLDGDVFAWQPEMVAVYRRKWLYNTVINTLCAVGRLPRNGELLHEIKTLTATFDEAFDLGVSLWGPWAEDRETLKHGMLSLIRETGANENSMARDVRLGRKTESLFLAGLATDSQRFPILTSLHARLEALATQVGVGE